MRLFFGISLPDEIRAVTSDCAIRAAQTVPGRYAPAENHHITLAFLGDVPKQRLEDAQHVLERCVRAYPAPELTLDGYSHFGRAQNGILILRVKSDPPLEPMHDAMIAALAQEGLPADRGPFSPHITLARHAQICTDLPAGPNAGFRVKNAHVFLSARDQDGVLRYTPLYTALFSE